MKINQFTFWSGEVHALPLGVAGRINWPLLKALISLSSSFSAWTFWPPIFFCPPPFCDAGEYWWRVLLLEIKLLKYLLCRMPAPQHRVLWRGDAQGVHGVELCATMQVCLFVCVMGLTYAAVIMFRNGRLELQAMHHGAMLRAMQKFQGNQKPWIEVFFMSALGA